MRAQAQEPWTETGAIMSEQAPEKSKGPQEHCQHLLPLTSLPARFLKYPSRAKSRSESLMPPRVAGGDRRQAAPAAFQTDTHETPAYLMHKESRGRSPH